MSLPSSGTYRSMSAILRVAWSNGKDSNACRGLWCTKFSITGWLGRSWALRRTALAMSAERRCWSDPALLPRPPNEEAWRCRLRRCPISAGTPCLWHHPSILVLINGDSSINHAMSCSVQCGERANVVKEGSDLRRRHSAGVCVCVCVRGGASVQSLHRHNARCVGVRITRLDVHECHRVLQRAMCEENSIFCHTAPCWLTFERQLNCQCST